MDLLYALDLPTVAVVFGLVYLSIFLFSRKQRPTVCICSQLLAVMLLMTIYALLVISKANTPGIFKMLSWAM